MTTSVKIAAHCSDDKEVQINLSNDPDSVANDENWTLQNGEELELFVYDDREISVKEVEKTA